MHLNAQELALRSRTQYLLNPDIPAWFQLEMGGFGEPRKSVIGVASELIVCEPGREREFQQTLTDAWVCDEAHDGWILLLAYEFAAKASGADGPRAIALKIAEMQTVSPASTPTKSVSLSTNGLKSMPRMNEKAYIDAIARAQSIIAAGDASVLCLTNQFQVSTNKNPLDIFLELQQLSDAPRGAVIEWRGGWLVSASPERFLSKDGARVSTSPIKGTRPRGATAEADEALRQELLSSHKENTENLRVSRAVQAELESVFGEHADRPS